MNYNNYDIIETLEPIKYLGASNDETEVVKVIGKGIEGTIVESYPNQYLIEFIDCNEVTVYVLVDEKKMKKKWDSKMKKWLFK